MTNSSQGSNQNPMVQVAVDAPLKEPLTYLAQSDQADSDTVELTRGTPVVVPLGKRTVKAVVLGSSTNSGNFKIKAIKSIDADRPRLPATFVSWLEWLASYYLHPIGQVTALAFAPLKRAMKPRKSRRSAVIPDVPYSSPPVLTDEQTICFNKIKDNFKFAVHLLYGVTGSGKTEVYLHLLEEVLKRGQQGIVLVPEISLTPQLIRRFSARFPDQVAVIHSHLTEREKTNQWWDIIDGKKSILVGARSALFCPIENLGIIIIDEEHEPSFKQDEKLKYHARDAAIVLAKLHDCPIILGSATPSLESWKNVKEGKYQVHKMTKRVSERHMPDIHVVDMRTLRADRKQSDKQISGLPFWMSELLFEKMQHTFEQKQQTALFLNRRGMAQVVVCQACGYVYECPNCAISLTLHAHSHLVCHYCDYTHELKDKCPQCSEAEVRPLGLGTELVEQDIQKLFPTAKVARADRDEINSREDLENMIESMESGETDILVGTQMIAKGLDFPGLTLVGLVMADVGFNLPDFRSSERSFQLLTQVSGRSGRHIDEPGQVVIQTYNPEHLSIAYARNNNFDGFAQQELGFRRELNYPPYGRLACIRIHGLDHNKTLHTAELLSQRGEQLRNQLSNYQSIMVLGPAPAPIAKLRGKFRYNLLIKGSSAQVLNHFCRQLISDLSWAPSATKVQIDIDPINML